MNHAADQQSARASWYRYGVLFPGFVVLAISVAMLLGWVYQPEVFRRFNLTFGETKPNSALGFVFLSISLLLLDSPHRPLRILSRAAAVSAALLGAMTGFEFLTGINLGIDHRFLAVFAGGTGELDPPRMSAVSALNLTMLGLAIPWIDKSWGRYSPTAVFTWATAALSFLALTGYAYDPGSLQPLQVFSRVSLSVSVIFLLLCMAIMFARPERGAGAIVLRRDLGGEAARRLLPAAIFIPFTASLVIFKMYQAGTYGSALMIFLFVVAPVVIFVPLVLFSASLLSRMEKVRRQSEDELRVSTDRKSVV